MKITERSASAITPSLLAGLYCLSICIGAALLKLPHAANTAISWSDALFTATSAVTVTGLVVVDPGTTLTFFGQAVLLALIQLGGVGLMTFAVVILSSLGMPVGLGQRRFLQEETGFRTLGGLMPLVRSIVVIVLIGELIGLCVLTPALSRDYALTHAVWLALFHSVSAFCNAGFTLFPDSLSGFSDQPLVLYTLSVQFIVGGLGFAVLAELLRTRSWSGFGLQTRLMLAGTASLIALSTLTIAVLEWHNPATLGAVSGLSAKLSVVWLEALTPRTAGFNVVDTASMRESTTLLTMGLMLIGGGSTSTAGGLKVTTVVMLLLATVAFLRRRTQVQAFGFGIGLQEMLKVLALVAVSALILFCSLFALLASHEELPFRDAAFEVVSAFGTVGLSLGVTDRLNEFGRFVVCVLMFVGRTGPLTLGFLLASTQAPLVRYPEGRVYLG